jgi:hypothetical protein
MAEDKTEDTTEDKSEDQTEGKGQGGGDKDGESAGDRWERAQEEIKELEDDPPTNLEDWPDDERKYVTFGGGEGDHGYDEGPEANLGPSSVRRFEDGSVEIEGEKVDNPDDYKAESIMGDSDHPADQN